MKDTRLILIEGLPGGGKTTTTNQLGKKLQEKGIDCRWYRESDDPHPIDCGHLKLRDLTEKLPPMWAAFASEAQKDAGVTIIESRLWQNTALFMFMAEFPMAEILQVHQLVWKELEGLSPVLIYLNEADVQKALKRLYQLRGKEAVEADIQSTSQYPWFKSRGLHDLDGWVQFFEAWQPAAEALYQDWPFAKTRIRNPHEDWARAFQEIFHFLEIA